MAVDIKTLRRTELGNAAHLVLDSESNTSVVIGVNLAVHDIPGATLELPRSVPLAVHCGHDYRATLGASLLERAGYRDLVVIDDGWAAWAALDTEGGDR